METENQSTNETKKRDMKKKERDRKKNPKKKAVLQLKDIAVVI